MAAVVQQVVGSGTAAVGQVLQEVGGAIYPGGVAPVQVAMDMDSARMGLTVDETLYMKGKDGKNEVFVLDQLAMDKLCQQCCCPICCTFIPFTSETRKMEIKKLCGCCSCRWAVSLDGQQVGSMTDVGCCDNGCLFCMCPCLTCDGYIKLMGMENANKEEKFLFASKLSPCWPLQMAIGAILGAIGLPCFFMQGCYNYVNGTSIKTITQPVYKGPWSRSSPNPPQELGKFYLTQRWVPCSLCCAIPLPMRFYYKATNAEGYNLDVNEQHTLGLALMLYRGLPTPCKMCSPAGFRTPTGIPCFDIGLETVTTWSNVTDVMVQSK